MINIIASISENNVLANSLGELPWVLPTDIKHFLEHIKYNKVVFGRRTFEVLGGKSFPNTQTIVITRNKKLLKVKGVTYFYSIQEFINSCKGTDVIWIAGGSSLFNIFIGLADNLFITRIHTIIPGNNNLLFPEINLSEWDMIGPTSTLLENSLQFSFLHYRRIPCQ